MDRDWERLPFAPLDREAAARYLPGGRLVRDGRLAALIDRGFASRRPRD